MFSIFCIEDVVNVEPEYNDSEIEKCIEISLRLKYVDKVLYNVGFCVGVYDILEINKKEILRGSGENRFLVIFRLIFFKPFENEVIEGFVKSSDANGIIISVGFFENIRVNCSNLREPKEYDEQRKEWFWMYEGVKFFYTKNELIRVRILDTYFTDPSDLNRDTSVPLMSITATVQQDGLGLIKWWR